MANTDAPTTSGVKTVNEVTWANPKIALRPGADVGSTAVNLTQLATRQSGQGIRHWPGGDNKTENPEGVYTGSVLLDPSWGLTFKDLHFTEPAYSQPHVLAELLQWRNLRLMFEDTGATAPISLGGKCETLALYPGGGVRTSDRSEIAWGMEAKYTVKGVQDPRRSGLSYTATVTHTILVRVPVADQEPGFFALAIKIFPMLKVSLMAKGSAAGLTPPSIAADLKMVHAPRVVRDFDPSANHEGERRTDDYYKPLSNGALKPGDVLCYLATDNNDSGRPAPGEGTVVPNPPNWDYVFDYLNPWVQSETAIQAVIYPRPNTSPSFQLTWDGAYTKPLTCIRVPGQGEFDNVHVSPYIGFDDPAGIDKTANKQLPMVEAPLAADEIIHMHWRWGVPIKDQALSNGNPAAGFLGWSDMPNSAPNVKEGAPLMPANQSLRIKLARAYPPAAEDNADDPPSSPARLDSNRLAIWYAPTCHQPPLNTTTIFNGQGYGLAYRMRRIGGSARGESNYELLVGATFAPDYHSIRFTGGKQRVPSASDIPGIQKNLLGLPGDPRKTALP